MHKAFSLLRLIICVFGSLLATSTSSIAQVTTDGTLNTQVDQNGNVAEITGGETAGNNVFHSFEQFSVPANNEAFFNNAENIANIFSRVTGGNISNIDGAIRANASANLFLVNPAGIIFGEGASLNIGGSFYGSTGSGVLFENGEFSATDLENPLLTVNAPIGLNLRDSSAQIINRSRFEAAAPDNVDNNLPNFDFNSSTPVGLQVNQGESIVLEAGSILFNGVATAPGGNITLKAIGDIDVVGDTQVSSFARPNSLNTSVEDNGGAIDIDSTQGSISISNTNLSSALVTPLSLNITEGNSSNTLVTEGSGGNISVNAQENVSLNNSFIDSTSDSSNGQGQGGNVLVRGANVRLENTRIDAASFSNGRSGDITIEATDGGNIELVGNNTGEQIDVSESGFTTDSNAAIFVDAYGGGDEAEPQTGGNLLVTGGSILIENYNLTSRVNEFSNSVVLSNPITTGDAGDIVITGNEIKIDNSSLVTETLGDGNAGNIELNASQNIAIANGTELNTRTVSFGSAGIITANANSLTLNNSQVEASNLPPESSDNLTVFAGNIELNLEQILTLSNDSIISAEAQGNANGGNIAIASEFIVAFPAQTRGSDIVASANAGRGGNINIQTESILGIAESPISEGNNINASSNLSGLDGTISIMTSNVNAIGEAVELASNVINVNDVTARTCSGDTSQSSTLSLKDRVRNPPGIREPFISDNIHFETQDAASQATPVKIIVANKQIVPAQAIIIKENGEIELTGKSLPEQKPRSRSIGCQ